jgi:periplasmic nitrate reductase NapE
LFSTSSAADVNGHKGPLAQIDNAKRCAKNRPIPWPVMNDIVERPNEALTRKQELRSFVFLAVVMAPLLAVIIVSGWGFLVWMFQLFAGPPGS